MGLFDVVECHPILDGAAGQKAVVDFFKVERLLFQGPPELFDDDVGEIEASTVHQDAHSSLS